jgi:F420-dependent oxidoreductase-like protein
VIEICRKVWRGERLVHEGRAFTVPLPEDRGTGLGKPLKFMGRPLREDIPIVVASLGPKNVELTAELAWGWQPLFFVPDRFRQVWAEPLAAGLARRDPALGELAVLAGGVVALGDGPHVAQAREGARQNAGFYVGGMGARSKNFYNDLFRRYGWEEEAATIQDLFLSGQREAAYAAVPEEYVDLAPLTGDEGRVRERIAVLKEVGVTHLMVEPVGEDPLEVLEKGKVWAE